MSYQRNHGRFLRARWRRRILVPAWTLQAALLFAILGIFAYRLAHTVRHFHDDDDDDGANKTVELVWQATSVGLGLLGAILTGFEVYRLLATTLTPFVLLACNVLKMTAAGAMLALDIVVYMTQNRSDADNWSTIGLALDGAALAAMLALGVYSIVAFRRLARTHGGLDDDDDADEPFTTLYDSNGVELATRYVGGSAGSGVAPGTSSSGYAPVVGGGLVANSAAMGSAVPPGSGYGYGGGYSDGGDISTAYDPPRAYSYNHARDTQFDAYVGAATSRGTMASLGTATIGGATRGMPPLSKGVIDGAIRAELWGGPSPGGSAASDRSNSLVGMGVVPAATPHHERVNRTASWSVEHGTALGPGGSAGPATAVIHEHDDEEEPSHAASS